MTDVLIHTGSPLRRTRDKEQRYNTQCTESRELELTRRSRMPNKMVVGSWLEENIMLVHYNTMENMNMNMPQIPTDTSKSFKLGSKIILKRG